MKPLLQPGGAFHFHFPGRGRGTCKDIPVTLAFAGGPGAPTRLPVDALPAAGSEAAMSDSSSVSTSPSTYLAGAGMHMHMADHQNANCNCNCKQQQLQQGEDNMAAAFQDILAMGRAAAGADPLLPSSWSATPDRDRLLGGGGASITHRVLQECRSLEAKLGFFDGDAMLTSLDMDNDTMSFRSHVAISTPEANCFFVSTIMNSKSPSLV